MTLLAGYVLQFKFNEISKLTKMQDGCLVAILFLITTNFIYDQLETKTNTYVKFQNCTISSFRGVARRTTFSNNVVIHVIENSK